VEGTGTENSSGGTSANGILSPCTAEEPGWNGTACVISGLTVSTLQNGGGHSLSFTWPHGPFGIGTYYPLFWDGGQEASSVGCHGFFGHRISNLILDGGGPGGADFAYYDCGGQEDVEVNNVTGRDCNATCGFVDGVGATTGVGHFRVWGGEYRMDPGNTPAAGYPTEANQIGMGYAWVLEGQGDFVWFSGANCSQYPQGYPSSFSGGGIAAITMTYHGTCSAAPTCHISSNQAGSGATCSATYGGGVVTGINVTAGGSGYSIGDTGSGAPFQFGAMTMNGTNTQIMQEGLLIDGFYNPDISDIHCEWTTGYCVHFGAGNGFLQFGTIHNIDSANTTQGPLRLGVGIDNNQTIYSIGKGVSGYAILDDANNFNTAGPVASYQPGGSVILNSLTVDGTGGVAIPNGGISTGSTSLTALACPSGVTGAWCAAENGTAGTPTAGVDYLRADSVAHCIKSSVNGGAEACLGSGTVSGSGTINTVAVWSGTTALGNSHISDATGLLSTTEGISVAPTASSQVPGIFNVPSGSTATYLLELQNNGTNEAAVNLSGEAFFGNGAPNPTVGTAGGLVCGEGTAPTLVSGQDGVYCNSSHYLDLVNGATDYGQVVAASNTNTLTNKTIDTAGTGNSIKIGGDALPSAVGTGNQVLAMNSGATAIVWATPTGVPCTTTASSLQYDNAGAFGCVTDWTASATTLTAAAAGIFNASAATGAAAVNLPAVVGGTQLTGTVTANLSAPVVIQNTNSTNNNTTIGMAVTTPGTSTGQVALNVNGATTQAALQTWTTGATYTAGVQSGATTVAQMLPTGALALGASPPAIAAGTGGGIGWNCGTAATGAASSDTQYCDAANQPHVLSGTTDLGIIATQSQTAQVVTADVTCGTAGTLTPCTSFTTITGLSFTLPLEAKTWSFSCDLIVGQATGVVADQFGVQTATNGATNISASGVGYTAAGVSTAAAITGVASTTTAQSILTMSPGATGTKLPVHLAGTIEGVSASGTVLNITVLTGSATDVLTVYRGSSCRIY
jgi:hypothetical protein